MVQENVFFWKMPVEQVVTELNSDLIKGLNAQEVESRFWKNGSNTMVKNKHLSDLNLLFNQFKSPFMVLPMK